MIKQKMNELSDDLLGMILEYLPRDGTNSRINAILTCKRWMNTYLNISLPPWRVFRICEDDYNGVDYSVDYCGIIGAFDVNAETIQFDYFYKWYDIANKNPSKPRFNLNELGFGDHMLTQACSYHRYMEEPEKTKTTELVIFLLNESKRRNQPFEISNAASSIMYSENIILGRIVFVDYPEFPITKNVLKKWCTILVYKREYPKEKELAENRNLMIAWIKNRPEMTKYRAIGQDAFLYK
tara:strand:+ start:15033 stop:15749 length:717 start_codon:yes stop_codon:yes gene_type:complete